MQEKSALEEFLALSLDSRRVAIFHEVEAASSPEAVFEAFEQERESGAILEYGLQKQDGERYSFLFFDSVAQFEVKGDMNLEGHPMKLLRQFISEYSCASPKKMGHFVSGAIGFITYDAVRFFEEIPDRHAIDQDFPDMLFNVYRSSMAYDHLEKKWIISQIVDVDSQPEKTFLKARAQMAKLADRICAAQDQEETVLKRIQVNLSEIETDISDADFINLVERAKSYIQRGDAFQIVLSRCFKKPYRARPFDIYKTLRRVSPSPYLFYLPLKDRVIVGASPETLISVKDCRVTINPIAGTRHRMPSMNLNEIEQDLLTDEKELAEHRMLVDLARNDIGAVCKPGSIKVREYAKVKHFSHVSHIASIVEGVLLEGRDALDAFSYAFPAGTLSGAPKIRAMEVIDALENSRRGLYGGAIVRCDFQNNLDSCIAIRMSILKEGIATVRTGAGIVFDSNPQSEAQETQQKANAMLEAIAISEGEAA